MERIIMDVNAYLRSCLEKVIEEKGQDVFFKAGTPPRMRLAGQVVPLPLKAPTGEEIAGLVDELLDLQQKEILQKNRSVDFGFSFHEKDCRFRANAFYQQGDLSLVFRLLWKGIPSFEELRLPPILEKIALEKSGIILIGGAVSSGKTTTAAAMVRIMNEKVSKHILTIEDPVEYLYEDGKCLIQQREIGRDAESFSSALKYVVRQSPDVIVIGEMRDAESFSFALSAAEVGRLVISTVHAQSAGQVFDRVLSFFEQSEREAILRYFAANISCIMVQKLLVAKDGKTLVPAAEVLLGNYTIKQLILDKKIDKIPQAIRNAHEAGMQTMDQSILELWKAGLISQETAIEASPSPEDLQAAMKGIRIGQDTKILGN
jgi:pilus retraction protein PilT